MDKKENDGREFRIFDESDFEDAKKALEKLFKKRRRLEIIKAIFCFLDLAVFVVLSVASIAFLRSGQDTNGIISGIYAIMSLIMALYFAK